MTRRTPRHTPPKTVSTPPPVQPVVAAVPAAMSPMEMLSSAMQNPNFKPELLEKLMDLTDRWNREQAQRAFVAAKADAKARIGVIQKNKSVKYENRDGKGKTSYDYAGLDDMYEEVVPVLAEYGLTHSYRSVQEGTTLKITCVLSHRDGHVEPGAEIGGPNDSSGGKNAIQAISSTATYLQRVTLALTLGLAAGKDDDGKAAGIVAFASPGQIKTIIGLMADTETSIKTDEGEPTAFANFLQERYAVEELTTLTPPQADNLIKVLGKKKGAMS